jgi:hypothetical protein
VVADTGRGFSDTPGAGVGLANIRERLAALYGETARLTLEANTPRGVIATIDVPGEARAPRGSARSAAQPQRLASRRRQAARPAPTPRAAPAASRARSRHFWQRAWQRVTRSSAAGASRSTTLPDAGGVAAVAAVASSSARPWAWSRWSSATSRSRGPGVLLALAGVLIGFVAVSAALALVSSCSTGSVLLFGIAIFVLVPC